MGLDVSLRKFKDFEGTKKRNKDYEEKSEKIWDEEMKKFGKKKYEELTKNERETISAMTDELSDKLGLGEYGEVKDDPIDVCEDSKKYPKHYWKIGYFRSSYNSGGFNTVIRGLIDADLYSIFDKTCDEYYFRPNWIESRKRAKQALKDLKTLVTGNGTFRALHVDCTSFSKTGVPKDNKEALDIFLEERKKYLEQKKGNNNTFQHYSNMYGEFSMGKPIEVFAFVKGERSFSLSGKNPDPCIYAIINDTHEYAYLKQCLEIVVENCEYVLEQKDYNNYYLGWSA